MNLLRNKAAKLFQRNQSVFGCWMVMLLLFGLLHLSQEGVAVEAIKRGHQIVLLENQCEDCPEFRIGLAAESDLEDLYKEDGSEEEFEEKYEDERSFFQLSYISKDFAKPQDAWESFFCFTAAAEDHIQIPFYILYHAWKAHLV